MSPPSKNQNLATRGERTVGAYLSRGESVVCDCGKLIYSYEDLKQFAANYIPPDSCVTCSFNHDPARARSKR